MGFLNKVKDIAQKGAEKGVDLGKKGLKKVLNQGLKDIMAPKNPQKRVTKKLRKNNY